MSRSFPFVPGEVEAFARSLSPRSGMHLQAIHEYTRADGTPWWWIARWKNSRTGDKLPLPFHHDETGFVRKMPGIPHGKRPLYHLHKLGQYPDDTVTVVEGELCADCLEAVGFIATTWPNGSSAAAATDWSPLSGRPVVLWPDNDAPGMEAMREARHILGNLGCVVAEIDVERLGLSPKGDVVDWLRAFVARHGARHLHEIPEGYTLAWTDIDALPFIKERTVAA